MFWSKTPKYPPPRRYQVKTATALHTVTGDSVVAKGGFTNDFTAIYLRGDVVLAVKTREVIHIIVADGLVEKP